MRLDTSEIASKRSPKLRLISLSHLDRRTRASARARALIAAFESELANSESLSASQRIAVERAAVMVAIAEDTRARRLAGDDRVNLDDLVRCDRAAAAAVRALGIKPKQSTALSLASYLAQRPA